MNFLRVTWVKLPIQEAGEVTLGNVVGRLFLISITSVRKLHCHCKFPLPGVEFVWGTWFSSLLGIVGYDPGLSRSSSYLFCLGDEVGSGGMACKIIKLIR